MKKTFLLSVLILSAVFILSGCLNTSVNSTNDANNQVIGGQKDENGCLIAAGYSWCPSQKKCMRMWEEYCQEYADQYRGSDKTTRDTVNLGGFCGSSTKALCQTDADCVSGGCSGQVCEKVGEGGVTTCEYADCYNKNQYGVVCGCVSGQCQWYK